MVPSRIQIKMADSEFAFPDMRLEVQKPLSADRRVSSDANRGKPKGAGSIGVLRSGSAGPLFEGSGPLRAQTPKRGPVPGKRTLCTSSLVGPLFGRFGPLKGQKGVQRLEQRTTLYLQVLSDPFLEDLDP